MITKEYAFSLFALTLVAACAQTPALTGGDWIVEDIAGARVVDSTRVSLKFSNDGKLSGSGGCNNYNGAYTLNGDEISIGPIASTKKACPPAIMNQETRFFGILQGASRMGLSDSGVLSIISDDIGAISARR